MSGFVDILRHPCIAALVALLVTMFLFNSFLDNASSVLGLLPANTLVAHKYIWNLLTSSFYEKTIVKLIFDLCVLFGVILRHGITVESYDQFILYIVFTCLSCSVCTSFYCFVRFFATGIEDMLLEPMYGFSSVLMALAMYVRAYKRDTPIFVGDSNRAGGESAVPSSILSHITYNNLPMIMTVFHFCCYCISPLRVLSHDWAFTCVSLFFTWSYCRFYYRFTEVNNTSNTTGEVEAGAPGASYAFIAMFPKPLHVVFNPFTTAFYNLIAITGLFPPIEVEERKGPRHHLDRDPSNHANAMSPLLKEKPDVVQERRRARALKLLDAKMAELNSSNADDDGWGDEEAAGPIDGDN
jgi:hypothetical protein